MRDTAGGREASFVINLKDQADLSAAYGMKDQDARGWYVYRTLKRSRPDAGADPAPARVARRLVSGVLGRERDRRRRATARRQRARGAVRREVIESNDRLNWLDRAPTSPAPREAIDRPDTSSPASPRCTRPSVWALGFTGQGIVVGGQDTGMRWTHNALKPHYRGWNGSTADHNYNWHDSIHSGGGICGPNHRSLATTLATARTRPAR